MKFCLFLTGTIDPKNTPEVDRASVLLRESDYYTSIEQYAALNFQIVFCENSEYDSKKISDLCASKNIEYLKFTSKESFKGKGHGEKEIFEYAFAHSKFLQESDYIVKVTGRIFIKNTELILHALEKKQFLVSSNLTRNLTWSDSRFFVFRKNFYDTFLKKKLEEDLNEPQKVNFEKCLSRAIHAALSQGEVWTTLPEYPDYVGYNAFQNKKLNQGLFKKIKYRLYYKIKKQILQQTI